MVFSKNNKGQAAIEFLMTYGWMLLVVLIVGALIFSFVDFSSLLPNQLDLSNSLRADASQMVASTSVDTTQIVVTYVGTRAATINASVMTLESDLGWQCNATHGDQLIENLDTGSIGNSSSTTAGGDSIQFINGQLGLVTFACDSGKLITGDTLEGEVKIPVVNTRTGLEVVSKGRIRLTIDE